MSGISDDSEGEVAVALHIACQSSSNPPVIVFRLVKLRIVRPAHVGEVVLNAEDIAVKIQVANIEHQSVVFNQLGEEMQNALLFVRVQRVARVVREEGPGVIAYAQQLLHVGSVQVVGHHVQNSVHGVRGVEEVVFINVCLIDNLNRTIRRAHQKELVGCHIVEQECIKKEPCHTENTLERGPEKTIRLFCTYQAFQVIAQIVGVIPLSAVDGSLQIIVNELSCIASLRGNEADRERVIDIGLVLVDGRDPTISNRNTLQVDVNRTRWHIEVLLADVFTDVGEIFACLTISDA